MDNMDFLPLNCPQSRFRARDLHTLLQPKQCHGFCKISRQCNLGFRIRSAGNTLNTGQIQTLVNAAWPSTDPRTDMHNIIHLLLIACWSMLNCATDYVCLVTMS